MELQTYVHSIVEAMATSRPFCWWLKNNGDFIGEDFNYNETKSAIASICCVRSCDALEYSEPALIKFTDHILRPWKRYCDDLNIV